MAPIVQYPEVRREETLEVLHGKIVPDHYRWLEDPDSAETTEFVTRQNELSSALYKGENRDKIHALTESLINFPRRGAPGLVGEKECKFYYYSYNEGLWNHAIMYKSKTAFGEDGEEFLNPNKWSEDGTTALGSTSFTEDGQWLAYTVSKAGSDWKEIKFKNVATGEELCEVVGQVKFGGATWVHSNEGVFYPRFLSKAGDGRETAKNVDQKIYFHKLHTCQEEDELFWEFPEHPDWNMGVGVTDDGKFLVLTAHASCDPHNQVYLAPIDTATDANNKLNLTQLKSNMKGLVTEFQGTYNVFANDGALFYFEVTDKEHPRGHLLKVDLTNFFATGVKPSANEWIEVVPQDSQGGVLESVTPTAHSKMVVTYMRDAASAVQMHDLSSGRLLHSIDLPLGSVSSVRSERKHTEVFFSFTSFNEPNRIYRFDSSVDTPSVEIVYKTTVPGIDTEDILVERFFVPSWDGKVKIPLFYLSSKKATQAYESTLTDEQKQQKTADRPCLLYGYGGFNVSLTPFYSSMYMSFLSSFPNSGAALACLRGGGEYGYEWYQAGVKDKKQTVFDDFFACAHFLSYEAKKTSPNKLVCMGGSNGGTLVGACLTQRPDLFGGALCQVPVMDMTRFHKFTIGRAWVSDFGNPDEASEIENILKWSPLHNINTPTVDRDSIDVNAQVPPKTTGFRSNVAWPPTLVCTADHDDRVVPLHSYKFVAEAQHKMTQNKQVACKHPVVMRVDVKAGHGAGTSTKKTIDNYADMFGFIANALKITVPNPK